MLICFAGTLLGWGGVRHGNGADCTPAVVSQQSSPGPPRGYQQHPIYLSSLLTSRCLLPQPQLVAPACWVSSCISGSRHPISSLPCDPRATAQSVTLSGSLKKRAGLDMTLSWHFEGIFFFLPNSHLGFVSIEESTGGGLKYLSGHFTPSLVFSMGWGQLASLPSGLGLGKLWQWVREDEGCGI